MERIELLKKRHDLKKGIRRSNEYIRKLILANPDLSASLLEQKVNSRIRIDFKKVELRSKMRRTSRPFDWYKDKNTNGVVWLKGNGEQEGYEHLGYYHTEIDAYNNRQFYDGDTQSLSYNGQFVRQYLDEVTVTYDSRNWIQRNLVLKLQSKSSLGAQIGVKSSIGSLQGGLVTTDIGYVEIDIVGLTADADWGNGDLHNYFGGGVGLGRGKKRIGLGGTLDYVVKNNYGNYNLERGDIDWDFSIGKSFGPGVKNGYQNLGIRPKAKLKSKDDDCYCIDIGIGAKLILGIEVNLKVGIAE